MDEVPTLERPPTLTEAVIRYLQTAIVEGRFPPGSQLPELRLANQLQNSRGTIREALHALREQGLVDIYPHRGAFVAQMTARSVAEVMELRALLESYAVKVALEGGIDPALSAAVEAAYEQLGAMVASGNNLGMVEADVNLHAAISACANNDTLQVLLGRLHVQTHRFILLTKIYGSDGIDELHAHAPIMAAFHARNPDLAEATVREHVFRTGTELLERMTTDAAHARPHDSAHTARRRVVPDGVRVDRPTLAIEGPTTPSGQTPHSGPGQPVLTVAAASAAENGYQPADSHGRKETADNNL